MNQIFSAAPPGAAKMKQNILANKTNLGARPRKRSVIMKKMKKLFAILMTMAMVMGLGITGFAAEKSATITIDNAGETARFTYVQIVEANPATETGWDIVDEYVNEFTGTGAFVGLTEQEILKGMIFKATNGTKGTKIDDFDSKYATALDAICGTIKAPTAETEQGSPITVDAAGVYVIRGYEEDYNYGTMAGYVAFGPYDQTTGVPTDLVDANVEAKRVPTEIQKSNDETDKVIEIGDDVTYTVTSTVPFVPTTDKNRFYKITDTITGAEYKLTDGKLNVRVQIGETYNKVWPATVNPKNVGDEEGQTFTLDLSTLLENNQYANDEITLTYTATVKKLLVNNKVVADDGDNVTTPSYGSDDDQLVSGVVTLTKKNEEGKILKGAEFKLYKVVEGKTKYAIVDSNGYLTGWTENKDETGTTLTTDDKGQIIVNGLDSGVTYKFEETKAPEGYTINENDATITWSDVPTNLDTPVTGTSDMTDTKLTALPLPGTGGMGTTLFTIAGCVIMISAAGLFFATRKKAN